MGKTVIKEPIIKRDFVDMFSEDVLSRGNVIMEIPLSDIDVNYQRNIRDTYESIDELAESIEREGLLSPITVYQSENGKYVPLWGYRRLKAYQRLCESHSSTKYQKIPCIIKPREVVDTENIDVLMIIENVQRENLKIIELRNGLEVLRKRGLTHAEIGSAIGKKVGYVRQIYAALSSLSENKAVEQLVQKCSASITLSDITEVQSLPERKQVELLQKKADGVISSKNELRKAVRETKQNAPVGTIADPRGETSDTRDDTKAVFHTVVPTAQPAPDTLYAINGDILTLRPCILNLKDSSEKERIDVITALEKIISIIRGE
ncbi:MAG: ParB N-terminal domain-containing protein [Spirochaetes bacterium]|nr:ParB N-terminal domain-containing protein [Spirochaetota bacterium]